MANILQLKELEKLLGNNKHDTGKVADIIPFITKPAKEMRNHFNEILGELVRNICEVESRPLKKKANDSIDFSDDPFIIEILKKIECSPDAEPDLERFLKQYLYGQGGKIKVFHPYIFNCLPITEKDTFRKFALFVSDVMVQKEEEIRSLFDSKEANDILSEIILDNLNVTRKKKSTDNEYQPILDFLPRYYKDDLVFLSNYKDYFLNSFPLLTHFYTFMYVCQLFLKFEQFDKADYNHATPLYFALEWETMSKRRKAVEEMEGFKRIKDKAHRLFVHVHTMSQLSYNSLVDEDRNDRKRFQTYKELADTVLNKGPVIYEQFLQESKEWINIYSKLFNKRVTNKGEPEDLSAAIKILFECVSEGMHEDAKKNYGKNIEDLGGQEFLKNRRSLGTVLNMSHEMILLLTAVCVKYERMPLKQLFDEFTKRGVNFDRLSKKAIIELFDSLNIIDKKSDSGDAQYVKPIL